MHSPWKDTGATHHQQLRGHSQQRTSNERDGHADSWRQRPPVELVRPLTDEGLPLMVHTQTR